MKVKVRNKIYDSENEPVMVIFTDQDKENIGCILAKAYKYCAYPDGMQEKHVIEFMKTEE